MRKKISELNMLSLEEEYMLKEQFNNTFADYPRDKCVHQLFEEQVLKIPDKTAVIACDKTLTYDELNKLSNRIANSLIEKGVKANDIVAFSLPREGALIAVMFGILKSGAAYLPIDLDIPQGRAEYMIEDKLTGRGKNRIRTVTSPFLKQDLQPNGNNAAMAKRMLYVGFSRPTHLLCYASDKRVWKDDVLQMMEDAGWKVEIV